MEESANNDEPCIYNMSQIISFPGYNQYPGKKFIDVSQHSREREELFNIYSSILNICINIKFNILGVC